MTPFKTLILCIGLWLLTSLTAVDAAEPIPLRAGPLTMVFDVDNAFLRYIKAGSHEVLRGINAPIRNQVWGTVRPSVSNVVLQDGGDHFSLAFDALCQEKNVDFRWKGRLTGSSDGHVEFTFDGVAHSTFMRNRIGFCVLHGPSAAGQPWVIRHIDGEKSAGRFPNFISPHQPVMCIRGISHEVAPALQAHVRMEGDTFEMEDQRNWTDASFKTYCTPLELPYPAKIEQGTKISQKVSIRLEGNVPPAAPVTDQVILTRGEARTPLPRIGLQVSSESDELSVRQQQLLRALRLDHLRIDLNLSDGAFIRKLRTATHQAKVLDLNLHIGIHPTERLDKHLQVLAAELQNLQPPVSAFLFIRFDAQQQQLARERLELTSGQSLIAVGYDTNFVDLNRDRPGKDQGDAVFWAINPQCHAFDNASMTETLPIQADTVRTARQFAGAKPLLISPVTLRPQQVSRPPLSGALPLDVDVRQPTLFAAGWTIGSLNYLASANVHSVTFYETVGWKGIMDFQAPRDRPGQFPSMAGDVFPVYHVLRDIGRFCGGQVLDIKSSDPLSVVGLVLSKAGEERRLIANLTDRQQSVTFEGFVGRFSASTLDTRMAAAANKNPDIWYNHPALQSASSTSLILPPHAVARIDWTGTE